MIVDMSMGEGVGRAAVERAGATAGAARPPRHAEPRAGTTVVLRRVGSRETLTGTPLEPELVVESASTSP
ncbi:hypothetical protein GCM10010280_65290 [Streptomyces pilosus]|uniref:Uncharacterized protein n=1 Tax=Streptomyces pilosus TaxID=28893 RepID=A0A918C602_9ACTN|nr:hypothetical protein GCM10010280_65290 [Streptomyces pilosus]